MSKSRPKVQDYTYSWRFEWRTASGFEFQAFINSILFFGEDDPPNERFVTAFANAHMLLINNGTISFVDFVEYVLNARPADITVFDKDGEAHTVEDIFGT